MFAHNKELLIDEDPKLQAFLKALYKLSTAGNEFIEQHDNYYLVSARYFDSLGRGWGRTTVERLIKRLINDIKLINVETVYKNNTKYAIRCFTLNDPVDIVIANADKFRIKQEARKAKLETISSAELATSMGKLGDMFEQHQVTLFSFLGQFLSKVMSPSLHRRNSYKHTIKIMGEEAVVETTSTEEFGVFKINPDFRYYLATLTCAEEILRHHQAHQPNRSLSSFRQFKIPLYDIKEKSSKSIAQERSGDTTRQVYNSLNRTYRSFVDIRDLPKTFLQQLNLDAGGINEFSFRFISTLSFRKEGKKDKQIALIEFPDNIHRMLVNQVRTNANNPIASVELLQEQDEFLQLMVFLHSEFEANNYLKVDMNIKRIIRVLQLFNGKRSALEVFNWLAEKLNLQMVGSESQSVRSYGLEMSLFLYGDDYDLAADERYGLRISNYLEQKRLHDDLVCSVSKTFITS